MIKSLFEKITNNFGLDEYVLRILQLGFISAYIFFLYESLPVVLKSLPATGGDMGSHLWPVVALREYGIPNLTLRIWSPSNFIGEPLLIHYFPAPFIFIALLSYISPIGFAFNLVTFLPIALTPIAVAYATTKSCKAFRLSSWVRRISGPLSGLLAFGVLFNDGYTMWGGNVLSVMAGQFAHQWALVFFFVFVGLVPDFLSGRRIFISSVVFALVVMCHGYVALFLPMLFIASAFLGTANFGQRVKRLFTVGILGSCLSAWHWWPLIDNSKWTTPYGLTWQFRDFANEVFAAQTLPIYGLIFFSLVYFGFRPKKLPQLVSPSIFWGLQLGFGGLCFATFTAIGLVDIRTVPQMQYTVAAFATILVATIAYSAPRFYRYVAILLLLTVLPSLFLLTEAPRKKYLGWLNWNYSGWTNKKAYSSLVHLSNEISGDFNSPRVSYEHSGKSNVAGTPRVFEMLPYFSGRSTTDGLYMQSTIVAPMAFMHQAMLSVNPSCPFPDYGCSKIDISRGVDVGRLFGVDTYIFWTEKTEKLAEKEPRLDKLLKTPYWSVFQDREFNHGYVQVVEKEPEIIDYANWRGDFWTWFKAFKPGAKLQLTSPTISSDKLAGLVNSKSFGSNCAPKIDIKFNQLNLTTNCPGKLHLLKFAYHDSWRSSGNEDLLLVSPGFMGIVPKSLNTQLRFGQSNSWTITSWISSLSWIGLFMFAILRRFKYYYMQIRHLQ